MESGHRKTFLQQHSLSLVTAAVLVAWIVLYIHSNPGTHLGAFFGNAIADWTGLLVSVLATKFLYEVGSVESRSAAPSLAQPGHRSAARSLPHHLPRRDRHRLGVALRHFGPKLKVGTSRRKHRLGVDADFRRRLAHQAPTGIAFEGKSLKKRELLKIGGGCRLSSRKMVSS